MAHGSQRSSRKDRRVCCVSFFLYGSAKGILAEIADCENFAGTDCAFWWGGAYGKNPQLRMFV